MHSLTSILATSIATDRQRTATSARLARAMRSKPRTLGRRSRALRSAVAPLAGVGQR